MDYKNEKEFEPTDFSELTITNNFMFCNVMSDESICKDFLEAMLKIKIDRIVYINSEQQRSALINGKTVRFDVYVEDGNRVFDIEMQMTDTQELPLRARYYQSVIDAGYLRKSQNYSKLCESFIIFIMPADIFGEGLPRYTFENTCKEKSSVKLNDKTQKIFYNFSAYNEESDENVRNILRYFKEGEPLDSITDRMESRLDRLKNDADLRGRYMTWEMEMIMREEKFAHDYSRTVAKKLLKMGIPLEQISQGTDVPLDEIEKMQMEMTATV